MRGGARPFCNFPRLSRQMHHLDNQLSFLQEPRSLCSMRARGWVSERPKTCPTVGNLWCFHSSFFCAPNVAAGNCRSCIFEFLSCGLYHSQSDSRDPRSRNVPRTGVWDSVCGLLIFFDCHRSCRCLWLWLSQKFTDAHVGWGWSWDWLFDWGFSFVWTRNRWNILEFYLICT